jgi:hypothetical protein
MPTISNGELVLNNEFRGVKVGEVPINGVTFADKYLVQVDQMSLSKAAYDFFGLIRSLKSDATSLFQPPPGQARGNITAMNSTQSVVGLFWATSINSKSVYIQKSDLPYEVPPVAIPKPCTTYANSSTSQPSFWN